MKKRYTIDDEHQISVSGYYPNYIDETPFDMVVHYKDSDKINFISRHCTLEDARYNKKVYLAYHEDIKEDDVEIIDIRTNKRYL